MAKQLATSDVTIGLAGASGLGRPTGSVAPDDRGADHLGNTVARHGRNGGGRSAARKAVFSERMRGWATALVVLLCTGWLAACASPPSVLPAADGGPREHTVHVVSHGWHTGIVIDRAALAATGLLPEVEDFPDARFLEFGWGDRHFYMAPEGTIPMALEAALVPTSAVVLVLPLDRPQRAGGAPDVVELEVTDTTFHRLVLEVSASFERPEGGRAQPIGSGLSAGDRFYPAEGRFHLFNNCNTWVARILAASGIGISPAGVVTAQELMQRAREAQATR